MANIQAIYTIINVEPLNENRCCGLRKDGQPCNIVVAIASRGSADSILRQCCGLRSTSAELLDELMEVAGLLLCKRHHQNQASAVSKGWLRAWRRYETTLVSSRTVEREEVVTTDRPYHPPRTVQRTSQPTAMEQSETRYNNLYRALLQSNISPAEKLSILAAANGLSAPHAEPTTSSSSPTSRRTPIHTVPQNTMATAPSDGLALTRRRANEVTSSTPMAVASTQNQRNRTVRPILIPHSPTLSASSSTSTSSSINSSSSVSNISATGSNSRSSSNSRTSVSRQTRNTSTIEPLRQSHLECTVCTEPYTQDNIPYWECTRCQNRLHEACVREWREVSRPAAASCPYCRARI